MADNKFGFNPKYVVYIAIGFPIVALGFSWDISPLIPLAVGAIGIFYFNTEFVHKSEIPEHPPIDLGGQERQPYERYTPRRLEGEVPILRYPPNRPGVY